jgi:hypothetical protein
MRRRPTCLDIRIYLNELTIYDYMAFVESYDSRLVDDIVWRIMPADMILEGY